MIKTLVSLIVQLTGICRDNEIDLHRQVHCLDMKSNEWHIAALQVYENLFRQEAQKRYEMGELKFDREGGIIEAKKKK